MYISNILIFCSRASLETMYKNVDRLIQRAADLTGTDDYSPDAPIPNIQQVIKKIQFFAFETYTNAIDQM